MPAENLRDAIREAAHALGGEFTTTQLHDWIEVRYPLRWKDVSSHVRDLAVPRLPSSSFRDEDCFLRWVARGRYRLR